MDDKWRAEQDYVQNDDEEDIDISDPGKNISEDLVVTKYKMAGKIVNKVLNKVIDRCVVGTSCCEICVYGDQCMVEETGKVFRKVKTITKGIAFPTCVSVNNCICHFAPSRSDPDYILKTGDLIKVELAGHVDGFIASVCHTFVLDASPDNKVTGRKADVLLAAHYASEAALRTLIPGNSTYDVTTIVQQAAEAYKCKPVEGLLSYQLKQNKLMSGKRIILNPKGDDKKSLPKFDIEAHEVYCLEIAISTGEGTPREVDTKTTIYKKVDDSYYQLKLKSSRAFFKEVCNKHSVMPFHLRTFQDEKKVKLGLVECLKHNVITPFAVPYEKSGEYVAIFKFTVLLMPSGSHRITGLPCDSNLCESEYSYTNDPTLKDLIGKSINLKTIKKKRQRVIARDLMTKPTTHM